MKVSYTAHGQTSTVEIDHDDLTIDTVMEAIFGVLVAAGFAPQTVRQGMMNCADVAAEA